MEDWVIGVLLSIAAAFFASLGDNLVKLAHLRAKLAELANGAAGAPPLWKRPLWVGGIFCMVVLNVALSLASYAFADASLCIPFGGLHIVFNLGLAYKVNGEVSSWRAVGYNLLILAGVTVVLVTGNHDSQYFTAHEMWTNLFDPAFLLCSAVLGLSCAFLVSTVRSPKASRRRVGLVVFTGMVGSVTQVWAKALSGCLKDGAWGSPFLWLCVVLTIFFALSQVMLLNKCLDLFTASFVVPIVNSTIIVVGSVYAAIYFHEVNRWTWSSQVFVPAGIATTALGITLLSTEPDGEAQVEREYFAAHEGAAHTAEAHHEPQTAVRHQAPPEPGSAEEVEPCSSLVTDESYIRLEDGTEQIV
jgi:hypothetical protein